MGLLGSNEERLKNIHRGMLKQGWNGWKEMKIREIKRGAGIVALAGIAVVAFKVASNSDWNFNLGNSTSANKNAASPAEQSEVERLAEINRQFEASGKYLSYMEDKADVIRNSHRALVQFNDKDPIITFPNGVKLQVTDPDKSMVNIIWPTGERYEGPVDAQTLPHGLGRYIEQNGDMYQGSWVHGKKHGLGMQVKVVVGMVSMEVKEEEGIFVNNHLRGAGLTEEKPLMTGNHGPVRFMYYPGVSHLFQDAPQRHDSFPFEKRFRHKTVTYSSGAVFEGTTEFISGERDGLGTLDYKDGGRYEGDFVNNDRAKSGAMFYDNGDVYFGDFWNDQPNGYGTYIWANGARYDGAWKDGKRDGRGFMIKANGNAVFGEWEKGQQHGHSVEITAMDSRTEGYWERGQYIGHNPRIAQNAPVLSQ